MLRPGPRDCLLQPVRRTAHRLRGQPRCRARAFWIFSFPRPTAPAGRQSTRGPGGYAAARIERQIRCRDGTPPVVAECPLLARLRWLSGPTDRRPRYYRAQSGSGSGTERRAIGRHRADVRGTGSREPQCPAAPPGLPRDALTEAGRPAGYAPADWTIQQAQDDLHRLYEDVREYAAPIKLVLRECDLAEIWRRAWTHLEPSRARQAGEAPRDTAAWAT